MPCVQHASMPVRREGVLSLGLYSLLSLEQAKVNIPLLLQVLKHDRDYVSLVALTVIFDLILCFGAEKISAEEEQLENILVKKKKKIGKNREKSQQISFSFFSFLFGFL